MRKVSSQIRLCSLHRLIRDSTFWLNWIFAKKRLKLKVLSLISLCRLHRLIWYGTLRTCIKPPFHRAHTSFSRFCLNACTMLKGLAGFLYQARSLTPDLWCWALTDWYQQSPHLTAWYPALSQINRFQLYILHPTNYWTAIVFSLCMPL